MLVNMNPLSLVPLPPLPLLSHRYPDFNRIISSKDVSELRTRSIYHRAGTLVKLKRYESAIEDLRGLLRVDPNSLYPRMLLGKALKMIGDLQNAEESVSRGIDLDPKIPDSYIERGDIRCRMGSKKKIDEAISGLFGHCLTPDLFLNL
jgi:tetratricopeptide (TPR) repeat protein